SPFVPRSLKVCAAFTGRLVKLNPSTDFGSLTLPARRAASNRVFQSLATWCAVLHVPPEIRSLNTPKVFGPPDRNGKRRSPDVHFSVGADAFAAPAGSAASATASTAAASARTILLLMRVILAPAPARVYGNCAALKDSTERGLDCDWRWVAGGSLAIST